ncbi:MAG: pyruvate formate-lyase-activating protein [Bacillota bacterium]|nr:pyruvate formate-lyase-activating protein [Bacillota bacterium]
MLGRIHSIETFGGVDGPGTRFVLFMQGCPLRCKFCHNPDTWDPTKGKQVSAEEVIQKALRYREYWGKDGGITVSGGEPLMQMEFLLELFTEAKKYGINTCIDTSGGCYSDHGPRFELFKKLMEVTDLLLVDIKHIDPAEHIALTGVANDDIMKMFAYLDSIHKPIWIRHVLVPGISDFDGYLRRMASFIATLSNVEKVEVLPFHKFGEYKWELLGIPYQLKDTEPPTQERVENAERILNAGLEQSKLRREKQ